MIEITTKGPTADALRDTILIMLTSMRSSADPILEASQKLEDQEKREEVRKAMKELLEWTTSLQGKLGQVQDTTRLGTILNEILPLYREVAENVLTLNTELAYIASRQKADEGQVAVVIDIATHKRKLDPDR